MMKNTKLKPRERVGREISAGFVVCRRTEEGPKFLLLYHGHNYWNFPKGHIESEEKAFAAAIRETTEEAGLSRQDLRVFPDFKASERYFFRKEGKPVLKVVIFYLAETHKSGIRISHEHQGYGWFLYREAMRILGRYKSSQRVLKDAYDCLRGKSSASGKENSPRQDAHV